MTPKIKHLIISAAILSLLSVLANAELSKSAQEKVTSFCKNAIEKKGYRDYIYKSVNVDQARSGNYGMIGQIYKNSIRYEFNCVLNKEIESLKLKDLVINPLN